MKSIVNIFNGEYLKRNLRFTIQRFPFPVILSLVVTGIFLVLVYNTQLHSDITQLLGRVQYSLIVTFFLAVGMKLYSESQNFDTIKSFLISIIFPLIFGGLFFFFLKNDLTDYQSITFIVVTLFGIISLLFFAPYMKRIIGKDFSQNAYFSYFYSIATLVLVSCIFGGLLFLLGVIGISAVFTLFDLDSISQSKTLGAWASLALACITPIFGLSYIPKRDAFLSEYFNENIFFSFLIRFVVIPFVFMYFIILYLYSVKVLMHFGEWPRGEVAWMVIGFSILGYASYIFSYIFEKKNIFIARFRKYFPFVVIPQLFMLFYAIYLRIAQYDLTINRYLVVVFGIWLLIISLYYIISREKRLVIIPAVITLFTLIISLGPWSVYSLPAERQYKRLIKNLVVSGICSDDSCSQVEPLKEYTDIPADLSRNIYSGIEYVCRFDNCDRIKALFPKIYADLEKKSRKDYEEQQKNDNDLQGSSYEGLSKWEIKRGIADVLKVQSYYPGAQKERERYFSFYSQNDEYPLDIQGYNMMYAMNLHGGREGVQYNRTTKTLIVGTGALKQDIQMQPIFDAIIAGVHSRDVIEYTGDNFKMIILNAQLPRNPSQVESNDSIRESMYGYILVK